VSDAWGLLRTYSTADADADAWSQLTSQEGGGSGEVIHVGPTLDADTGDMALTVDMTTALSANLVIDEVTASADTALTTSAASTTLEAGICQQ
jgi:hypothetical protein